ncbi:CDK5 regulatory subunit associated protein 1 like 1 [Willisornis vidua]|uniref:tRNA (N(6)-L-threonylcarbamoyladenosine(37)-C(2))-methylthiotransferase n=1 Tax=Willisornis vidua TaxID=1566151 RepID=A0ABQ9DH76_9PASS|nr:CDK5 regulatory subunit associated protein 1 like 1 [Willisornis vidua]
MFHVRHPMESCRAFHSDGSGEPNTVGVRKAQEGKKKVVVAGCVPQAQPRQDYLKGLSIIGVQQIDRVVEVVEETIKGHSVRFLGQKKDHGKRLGGARLDLPKIRKNPLIEIISINTGPSNSHPMFSAFPSTILLSPFWIHETVPEQAQQDCIWWLAPGAAYVERCLNACTYCKTKHARGDLASYPIEELVDRARQSFQVTEQERGCLFLSSIKPVLFRMKQLLESSEETLGYAAREYGRAKRRSGQYSQDYDLKEAEGKEIGIPGSCARAELFQINVVNDGQELVGLWDIKEGVCEIWLTSEDTGAYGRDIGTDLPTLLWRLVEVIPEGAMLRLGMTNPPYILEHLEEMAKILSHPRVYAFLHIPVQSGSDSVLMDMRREYCVADFRQVVDFLKEKVPGITIATDIICGFPGETDEDFQETVRLVEQYRFPSLFINQFYPRPGTPAAKLPQLPPAVKKQRTKDLSQLFHSYNPYDHKVGERQRVLVTEESFDSNYYVAHNPFYEQVLVPKDPLLMGKMVEVSIYEAGKHFLKGQPVADGRAHPASISRPLAKGEVSGLTEEFRRAPRNGPRWRGVPSAETPEQPPLLSPCLALQPPWQGGGALRILSASLALLALLVMFYCAGVKTEL